MIKQQVGLDRTVTDHVKPLPTWCRCFHKTKPVVHIKVEHYQHFASDYCHKWGKWTRTHTYACEAVRLQSYLWVNSAGV